MEIKRFVSDQSDFTKRFERSYQPVLIGDNQIFERTLINNIYQLISIIGVVIFFV